MNYKVVRGGLPFVRRLKLQDLMHGLGPMPAFAGVTFFGKETDAIGAVGVVIPNIFVPYSVG